MPRSFIIGSPVAVSVLDVVAAAAVESPEVNALWLPEVQAMAKPASNAARVMVGRVNSRDIGKP
jgi:hypothetical protein